jgi:glucose/arabinose dehydrogenase
MRKLLGTAFVAALISSVPGPAVQAQQLTVRRLATGLTNLTSIVNAHDSRLFLTLQRGQIRIWDGTAILPAPFLDISSRVSCCGEQGLLSVAFHPRYRENGFFFVNYTDLQGRTIVARYSVSADRNVANPDSESILLTIPQPFDNHNGGELQFGPDGYLYIGMGDGGSGGDPQNNGQSLNTLLGKMLRIDVDSAAPYAIPPSNPFATSTTARREIWAYGLRNPWRFTFDRENGDLWIADVGQGAWEEVDLQRSTSIGGENYGWRKMEGRHCFNPSSNCTEASMTLPVVEYSHSFGCSITGGYRYRGARYPAMRGLYFFADYCSGDIWGARESVSGNWTASVLLDTTLSLTTFGEDENGELYVGEQGGGFYALADTTPRPPRRRAAGR